MSAGDWSFQIEVGKRIRKARLGKRVSQAALGRMVGLSRTSIVNIEHGRQNCMLEKFCQIAQALDSDPGALLPPRTVKVPSPATLLATSKLQADERAFVLSISPTERTTDNATSKAEADRAEGRRPARYRRGKGAAS